MRDNGYNDTNAKILVRFYKQLKSRRQGNVSGVWTIRKIIKAYKTGAISSPDARLLLAPHFVNVDQINDIMRAADFEIQADTRTAWIKTYKRRYITGEYDFIAALTALIEQGIEDSRANEIIGIWRAERDGRLKEPTIRMLQDWARKGIISAASLNDRLRRLGYTQPDAERIIYSVQVDINREIQREYEKTAKELEKRFKDRESARKATEKELKTRLKELEKEQDRIQKELEKRQPQDSG
jgi:hypothetical protein